MKTTYIISTFVLLSHAAVKLFTSCRQVALPCMERNCCTQKILSIRYDIRWSLMIDLNIVNKTA